ncbi:MAG: hypothetical protein WBA93_28025 [Microcoleaceae cyanobacterium]
MFANLRQIGFEYFGNPGELPEWAEIIWYKYDQMFLSNNSPDLEEIFESIETELFVDTYAYIKQGIALKGIQFRKLYKEHGFRSFKDYCLKRLKMTTQRANQIIKAAQISWSLLINGCEELPANVSQAYALYTSRPQNKDDDRSIQDIWEGIVNYTKQTNTNITTKKIEETINPNKKKKSAPLKLPKDVRARLEEEARELGTNLDDLATQIIKQYLGMESKPETQSQGKPEAKPETKPQEESAKLPLTATEQKWLADLDELCHEHESKQKKENDNQTNTS